MGGLRVVLGLVQRREGGLTLGIYESDLIGRGEYM